MTLTSSPANADDLFARRAKDWRMGVVLYQVFTDRTTDKIRESVLMIVNPTGETVTETFATRLGRLMSWGEFEDAFTGVKRDRSPECSPRK